MSTTRRPLWQLSGITKSYPGVRANKGISIDLFAGEIHALLGENGCGKSTLIKILSGVIQPDAGEIRLDGAVVTLADPVEARSKGIATVFQEFSLAPTLTVAENIFLGRYPSRGPFVDWRRMRADARRIMDELEIAIDPGARVNTLSVASQQLVEIAKALSMRSRLLILDEPTTALGSDEIAVLHAILRRLKSRGVAILYISHRLDEVVDIADCATILKDGAVVRTSEGAVPAVGEIVSAMVGRDIGEHYPKERHATGDVVLEARGLSTARGVAHVSFDLRRGEVLGLGGVIGSGRTEIARALFGADRLTAGEIRIGGRPLRLASPRDAIRAGIALVPENRKFDGLFFNFRGAPNISSAALGRLTRFGFLSHSGERAVADRFIGELEISAAARDKTVNLLSGGNQQKIVIARWLYAGARVLILDEPTQGIDVGAKLAVYEIINRLTSLGTSIVLISSDHAELLAMSDRIAIVRRGRVVGLRQASDVDHRMLVDGSSEREAADEAA